MADQDKPWWHSSGAVAAVTTLLLTILGGIVTAATAATGYFEKSRELELEHEKHVNDLRLAYLDRLGAPLLRQQTLQFMQIDETDERLRQWAVAELKKIEPEVEGLKEKLTKSEKDLADALARIDALDTQLHKAIATASPAAEGGAHAAPQSSRGEAGRIKDELEHARADLEQKQAAVAERRAALGVDMVNELQTVPRRRVLNRPMLQQAE